MFKKGDKIVDADMLSREGEVLGWSRQAGQYVVKWTAADPHDSEGCRRVAAGEQTHAHECQLRFANARFTPVVKDAQALDDAPPAAE